MSLESLKRALPVGRRPRPAEWLEVRNLTRNNLLASRVLVAADSASRRRGLLKHTGLAPDEGIWITPCESIHTFFMRFTIDVVYLDRARRVRKIRHSIPPWRISGCLSAASVLEFAAGTARARQLETGDQLELVPVPSA